MSVFWVVKAGADFVAVYDSRSVGSRTTAASGFETGASQTEIVPLEPSMSRSGDVTANSILPLGVAIIIDGRRRQVHDPAKITSTTLSSYLQEPSPKVSTFRCPRNPNHNLWSSANAHLVTNSQLLSYFLLQNLDLASKRRWAAEQRKDGTTTKRV